jgi:L-ascorbate 6-phosphate lactonase
LTDPLEDLRAVPTRDGRVGLTWLGQAGFALRAPGATLMIDPFLSPHAKRRFPSSLDPSAATGLDAVLCTHEHRDHLDAPSVRAIADASPGAVVVVPAPIVDQVVTAGVDRDRVIGMQPGSPVEVGAATVHAIPARHGVTMEDAYGFGEGLSDGRIRFLGYVIELAGVRLYHAGDTIHYDGMEERLRPFDLDLALLPVNGRDGEREARGLVGNLDEPEAVWLAGEIGTRTLVPMHHDLMTGNLGSSEAVVRAAEQEDRPVAVLIPHRESPFVVSGHDGR